MMMMIDDDDEGAVGFVKHSSIISSSIMSIIIDTYLCAARTLSYLLGPDHLFYLPSN